jgi:hypothetical protein
MSTSDPALDAYAAMTADRHWHFRTMVESCVWQRGPDASMCVSACGVITALAWCGVDPLLGPAMTSPSEGRSDPPKKQVSET